MKYRLIFVFVLLTHNLLGISTNKVTIDGDSFQQGTSLGFSIGLDKSMGMEVGPSVELLKEIIAPSDVVSAVAYDKRGSLFIALKDSGNVYKVNLSECVEGEALLMEPYVQIQAPQITSLAVDKAGNVFVGTAPEGNLYVVNKDRYLKKVDLKSKSKYLWDMAFDLDDNLLIATGSPAMLLSLHSAEGECEEVLSLKSSIASHLKSVYVDADGDLLLASGSKSYLFFYVKDDKRLLTLNDLGKDQVNGVVGDDDTYYFIASSGNDEGIDSLNRLDKYGNISVVWAANKKAQMQSIALRGDGSVLVGANMNGSIMKIGEFPDWKISANLDKGGRVIKIIPDSSQRDVFYAVTSNPVAVYKVDYNKKAEGEYFSHVIDAGRMVNWGRLWLKGVNVKDNENIIVGARTGNMPSVDSEGWSELLSIGNGGIIKGGKNKRYLQIFFRTKDERVNIKSVSAYYSVANRKPLTSKLHVLQQAQLKDKLKEYCSNSKLFKAIKDKVGDGAELSVQFNMEPDSTLVCWDALDTNDDILTYRIEMKRLGTEEWYVVEDNYFDTAYIIESIEDGDWQVRLVVSDYRSNSQETSKVSHRITEPFLIDTGKRRPKIRLGVESLVKEEGADPSLYLVIKAQSEISLIESVELEIDSRDSLKLHPIDGVYDSYSETCIWNLLKDKNFDLDKEHFIKVEVTDESGNKAIMYENIKFTHKKADLGEGVVSEERVEEITD